MRPAAYYPVFPRELPTANRQFQDSNIDAADSESLIADREMAAIRELADRVIPPRRPYSYPGWRIGGRPAEVVQRDRKSVV